MVIRLIYSTLYILLICLIPRNVHPCTTFCIDKGNQLVVGFNLNWVKGEGSIVVNKRNVSKTAMMNPEVAGCQPVSWTSKYGSITFNYLVPEIAGGGINETGLVMHGLALFSSKYPPLDSRSCIWQAQWIQYQLDNFDKVEQVIASDSQIRILQPPPSNITTHFFISDSTGNCATIEFLDGKLIYHTKETMPVKVLSNDTYDECISSLNIYKSWGGDIEVPQSRSAYDRFVRAADMVENFDTKTSIIDYAFNILGSLEGSMPIQWSIVYDIRNSKVFFNTLENKKIRHFTLSSFDFSCKSPVQVLDITADLSGDITNKFTDFNYERNRDLIKSLNLPEVITDILAQYPETTKCVDK